MTFNNYKKYIPKAYWKSHNVTAGNHTMSRAHGKMTANEVRVHVRNLTRKMRLFHLVYILMCQIGYQFTRYAVKLLRQFACETRVCA